MSAARIRRPRCRLVLDGATTAACQSVEVVCARGSQAARFHVIASMSELDRRLGQGWVDRDTLDVAVDLGLLPADAAEGDLTWVRTITGTADRIQLDQVSGQVSLSGRDYASRLLDLPVQEGYLNSTSSDLATRLAQLCDLTADVDPTQRLIGQYYQIQHTKTAFGGFSRHGNGWDLLAELAELEAYDLWIDGTTLHFKRPVVGDGTIHDVTYTAAAMGSASPRLTISNLSMDRSFGLSGSLQVNVSSWNSRQRRQVTASYPADDEGARRFLVLKPNLLPDDAAALAKTTYARLRSHQRVISGTMAGELNLTIRDRLRVTGTGTGWDCVYTIDRIEREMSLANGFVQHVVGRADPDQE